MCRMMQHRNRMMLKKEFICALFVLVLATLANAKQNRIKRMYAMCPPHFQRIGSECYYISSEPVNWLDAHFECKDRNSRLAEPYKYEDRLLRKYMQRADKSRTDFWIGGIFNWQRNKWQWGYNGRDMTYQSFSQMSAGTAQDLKFHCAILNPHLKYRWSARTCVDKHNYICQHRMPYVNEKNRQKVYNKWNETYPNEMANEIEEVIDEDDQLRNRRRNNRRPFNPNRQNNVNRQGNSIQTKLDDRLENRIDVPRPNDPFVPANRRRTNRQRSANGHGHRNVIQKNPFEPSYNRSRFHTIRDRIEFGENNDEALLKRRREHQRRRKNRLTTSTTTTTTTTTSTTIRPTTATEPIPIATTRPSPRFLPQSTENIDDKIRAEYENELAEERARQEQEEVDRYQAKLRRKQEEEEQRMKEEERRIYEENEKRTKHLKEMEQRNSELEKEREKEEEIERLRRQKQRQDEERKFQNEQNMVNYEEEKQRQADMLRQRESNVRQSPATLAPVLSNDVLDPTDTSNQQKAPKKQLSEEEKKRRRDAIRKRLQKLSPDEQQMYLQRKLERNRKRGIKESDHGDVQRTN